MGQLIAQQRELWYVCPRTILARALHELARSAWVVVEIGRNVVHLAVEYRPRVVFPPVLGHFGQRYPLVWKLEAGLCRQTE